MNSFRNILLLVLLFTFSIPNFAVAQTYPQDLDYSLRTEALLDAGIIWNINSLFHPLKYYLPDSAANKAGLGAYQWLQNYLIEYSEKTNQPVDTSRIGLNVLLASGIGMNYQAGAARSFDNVAFQPYIWMQAKFRNHWYSYLYIRATNEKESLPHFTGVPRDISRLGMNTGEIDQSVI